MFRKEIIISAGTIDYAIQGPPGRENALRTRPLLPWLRLQPLTPDQIARRVAFTSMLVSGFLAFWKITTGVMAGSTAVTSDGFESAGDVFASGLVLVGLYIAARPPDRDHPYGHGRFEILTGLFVGVLLSATGALISFRSFEHVLQRQPTPAAFAIAPMIFSIVLKSASWAAKRHYGRKINSESLVADSWNDAVDILSAITALAALGLTLYDPERFQSADPIGGFIVGLIVIFLGVHVIRDTTLELMDTMPDPPMMRRIREIAMSVNGALGVEKCFARKTGFKYHVDLHLEVDPSLSVRASHEIARAVKQQIKDHLDWVADVLVHVEPHE